MLLIKIENFVQSTDFNISIHYYCKINKVVCWNKTLLDSVHQLLNTAVWIVLWWILILILTVNATLYYYDKITKWLNSCQLLFDSKRWSYTFNTATHNHTHTIIAYRITAHKTNSHYYKRYLYKLVLSYRRLNISKMLRHHICKVPTYIVYIIQIIVQGF